MSERRTYWQGDLLLDPELHPPGTRLILSRRSNPVDPWEATILEWAPSGKRVKLQRSDGGNFWRECWDYDPVVVEVLHIPIKHPTNGYYWFKSERASERSIAQLVSGSWYLINEVGPMTLETINHRGWQVDERVS